MKTFGFVGVGITILVMAQMPDLRASECAVYLGTEPKAPLDQNDHKTVYAFLTERAAYLKRSRPDLSPEDISDAVHDAFMNWWSSSTYRSNRGPLEGYLFRILANAANRIATKKKRSGMVSLSSQNPSGESAIEDVIAAPGPRIADLVIEKEENEQFPLLLLIFSARFEAAWSKLSKDQQQALHLITEGPHGPALSYKEAAKHMGKKVEVLKMLIFRGRKKLAKLMGFSVSDSLDDSNERTQ